MCISKGLLEISFLLDLPWISTTPHPLLNTRSGLQRRELKIAKRADKIKSQIEDF